MRNILFVGSLQEFVIILKKSTDIFFHDHDCIKSLEHLVIFLRYSCEVFLTASVSVIV